MFSAKGAVSGQLAAARTLPTVRAQALKARLNASATHDVDQASVNELRCQRGGRNACFSWGVAPG